MLRYDWSAHIHILVPQDCLSVFLSFCLYVIGGHPSSSRVILYLSGRWRTKSGLDWMGWMVIIGQQSSKSTFGANQYCAHKDYTVVDWK